MLGRTLEAIFRRPVQLLLFIILLPLVSAAIAYALPRSYESTARLWALHPYQAIGTTQQAIDPQTNTPITPAQSQVNTLSELLQTRGFTRLVVKGTTLASTLGLDSAVLANPQRLDDALFQEISQHVKVVVIGYDLFSISYANHDPKVAQQVIEAVIQNYDVQSQQFNLATGQKLLESYQAQLVSARQAAAAATAAETLYLRSHPALTANGASPLSDLRYAQLDAQRLETQTKLQDIQTSIDTINQEIDTQGLGADSLFRVLDPPFVANQPVSRLGLLLTAGGTGLGLGLLACILYIVILVRRDHSVRTALDLRKVTALQIVMQLPHLTDTEFVNHSALLGAQAKE